MTKAPTATASWPTCPCRQLCFTTGWTSSSTLDNIDGQAALRSFLVLAHHVGAGLAHGLDDLIEKSEERRVGKECRSRWSPYHEKKKKRGMARERRHSRRASAPGGSRREWRGSGNRGASGQGGELEQERQSGAGRRV